MARPGKSGELMMTPYPDESDDEVIEKIRSTKGGEPASSVAFAGTTMVEASPGK